MNSPTHAPRCPDKVAFYGVIRSNSRRKWAGWPVEINFATVNGDRIIQSATMIVRPSAHWLKYRHPPIEADSANEMCFRDAVDAKTAAVVLNEAFGKISVYCPDVRCNVGRLYDDAEIAMTWRYADFFMPFKQHDIRAGEHAFMRMIDAVPERLSGIDRVRAHAQAYLDSFSD